MRMQARATETIGANRRALGETPVDRRALTLAVHLGCLMARPLSHLNPSIGGLGPLPPMALRRAAQLPAFATPLNRVTAENLAVAAMPIDGAFMERLTHDPRSRAAALIVTSPPETLNVAALTSAGAVLHRMIVSLVLKAQRGRAREALGEATFEMGIREVPMLYPALGDLLAGPLDWAEDVGSGVGDLRALFKRTGLQVLASFIDVVEPGLSPIFAHRFDADSGIADRAATIARMKEIQIDQLTKLLRRRMVGWADIIG